MHMISIDGKKIGENQPCYVISEIGAMYENIEDMKRLIKISKDAGADAAKIQTYRADTISLPGAEFEFENGTKIQQYDFFKKYEISLEDHRVLFDYAKQIGITLFSTPSYYDDVDFLYELGVPAFKTGSDDLTNYPFLEYIAKKGKPMFVSTGMCTLGEIEEAVNIIINTGNDQLVLLHCTTSYPPSPDNINLNVIKTLQNCFDVPVGYSDHYPGIFASILSASMGACVVEKHFTLDRKLKRQDYQVSIEYDELQELVENVHLLPILKGAFGKKICAQEQKWRNNARKSIVSAKDLVKGQTIAHDDVKIIRPASGLHPRHLSTVIGRTLQKNIQINTPILWEHI